MDRSPHAANPEVLSRLQVPDSENPAIFDHVKETLVCQGCGRFGNVTVGSPDHVGPGEITARIPRLDVQRSISGPTHQPIEHPLIGVGVAISIMIQLAPSSRWLPFFRKLLRRDTMIVVGVGFLEGLFERRTKDLFARIGPGEQPVRTTMPPSTTAAGLACQVNPPAYQSFSPVRSE